MCRPNSTFLLQTSHFAFIQHQHEHVTQTCLVKEQLMMRYTFSSAPLGFVVKLIVPSIVVIVLANSLKEGRVRGGSHCVNAIYVWWTCSMTYCNCAVVAMESSCSKAGGQWCSGGGMLFIRCSMLLISECCPPNYFVGGTPFPHLLSGHGGNADTVAFPQIGLQRNEQFRK